MSGRIVGASVQSRSSKATTRGQEALFHPLPAVNGMFQVDRTCHPEDLQESGRFLFKVAQHLLEDGLSAVELGGGIKEGTRALEGINLLYASTMLFQMSRLFNEAAAGQEAQS